MIDFRSDTVTRPTPEMRAAIAKAPVGDDVFDEDPSVHRLEETTAAILGKKAAIYMPSGTMTNQIAIRIHCKPGDEFICETLCHIYRSEQGAFAQLSGVVARTIPGEYGVWQLDQLKDVVRSADIHHVRTRMVAMENTHNSGGGRILPYDTVVEICDWAHQNGLTTHLDGARLFNAVVASGIDAATWCQHFDTVSVCFSKGLGAPVGSALAGDSAAIDEARRHRKAFGGGMRQAGIIAAGALYALENNVDRLTVDHRHAQILAEAIRGTEALRLPSHGVDTNILVFDVDERLGSASDFVAALFDRGVGMLAVGRQCIRAVTHLDVTEEDVRRAAEILRAVANEILVSRH